LPPAPENHGEPYQERIYRLEHKKFVVECLTLGGLVAYVVINLFTLRAMRDSNKSTRIAANAAEESAGAAVAASRAWILPTSFKISAPSDTGQQTVTISWIDAGPTAAFDVRGTAKSTIEYPDAMEPVECPKTDWESLQGLVQSKEPFPLEFSTDRMNAADLSSFKHKHLIVVIRGCVRYRDVLSEKERVTKFRLIDMWDDAHGAFSLTPALVLRSGPAPNTFTAIEFE